MLHIIKFLKNRSKLDLSIFLLIIFYWTSIWSSIGVGYKSILFFGNNLIENINFFRINFPLLLSLISSLFLIFKINKFKSFNILYLFYLYFLLQLIGLFFNSEVNFTLGNNFLIILGIGSINLFLILKIFNKENFSKYLLYSSIIFCTIFTLFILITNIDKMGEYLAYSTFYSLSLPSDRLLDNAYPRTTGLSRLFAVVNLFLIGLYINNFFKNKKIIGISLLAIIVIFGAIIWGFQSRGTIISYSSSILIIILLFKNKFQSKIINLFIILLIPIIVFQSASQIAKNKFLKKYDIQNINFENMSNEEKKKLKEVKQQSSYANRFLRTEMMTSGRIEIWKYALSNYDFKKIFGYGVQADRFILGKKYKSYGNNSSNVFLYFFICGGYLSLILLIIILSKVYYYCLNIYFKKDYNFIKESFLFKISLMLLIFFSVRGLVENSYGLFSIDFIFVISIIFIIENLYNKSMNLKIL